MRVPIDPEVDTELDVIHRVLVHSRGGLETHTAEAIRLNLLRLRSKKDLAEIARLDA